MTKDRVNDAVVEHLSVEAMMKKSNSTLVLVDEEVRSSARSKKNQAQEQHWI